MIDLHDALSEIRRQMGESPPGSAVRVKLMTAATALADAIAIEQGGRPGVNPCEAQSASPKNHAFDA